MGARNVFRAVADDDHVVRLDLCTSDQFGVAIFRDSHQFAAIPVIGTESAEEAPGRFEQRRVDSSALELQVRSCLQIT